MMQKIPRFQLHQAGLTIHFLWCSNGNSRNFNLPDIPNSEQPTLLRHGYRTRVIADNIAFCNLHPLVPHNSKSRISIWISSRWAGTLKMPRCYVLISTAAWEPWCGISVPLEIRCYFRSNCAIRHWDLDQLASTSDSATMERPKHKWESSMGY